MKNLTDIAKRVFKYKHRQPKRLLMSRNDYMIDEEKDEFYQVEYNLVAASLGPICQGARRVHTQINAMTKTSDTNNPLELNNTKPFIEAFKAAYKAYNKPQSIIVVIADYGNNLFDHLFPFEEIQLAGWVLIFISIIIPYI